MKNHLKVILVFLGDPGWHDQSLGCQALPNTFLFNPAKNQLHPIFSPQLATLHSHVHRIDPI
jgi:hypothetical protein